MADIKKNEAGKYESTIQAAKKNIGLQEKYLPDPVLKVEHETFCAEQKIAKSHLVLLLLESFYRELKKTGKVPTSIPVDFKMIEEIKANKYLR